MVALVMKTAEKVNAARYQMQYRCRLGMWKRLTASILEDGIATSI